MGALEGSERDAIDHLVDGGKLAVTDRRKIEHLSSLWQSGLIETALALGVVQAGDMALALAAVSGLPLLDPVDDPQDARLVQREALGSFVRARFMPWRHDGGVLVVAAVNPYTAESALASWREDATIAIKIVTEPMLTESLNEVLGSEAVEQAIFDLSDRAPELSARGGVTYFQGSWMATIAMLLGFALWRAPGESFAIAGVGSGLFFLAIMLFRLVLMVAGLTMPKREADFGLARASPSDLPAYSILVALRDEAALLPQIIAALSALDYPATKLDILLLLEESDPKTRGAVRALALDSRFRVLTVPDRFPRTKPKACNFGLAFARGEYIALYDAEDRPDPDQLLRALGVFEAHPETECVQGQLSFYNARENWLTRGIMAQTPRESELVHA